MAISYLCGFEMNAATEWPAPGALTVGTGGRNSGFCATLAVGTAPVTFSRAAAGSYRSIFQSFRVYAKADAQTLTIRLRSGVADGVSGTNQQGFSINATTRTVNVLGASGTVATSAAAFPNDGNWHRIDLDAGYNAGAGVRVYVDGTLYANSDSTTIALCNGVVAAVSTGTVLIDDFVGYDAALPATLNDYNLGLLLPVSDNAVGNWKRNDGLTNSNEFTAVDNTPPTGTATTAVLAANYIQNGTAGSGSANDRVDFGTQAFTNLTGLTDASQVKAVAAIANGAQQVTTGSPKSGSMTTYTNPGNPGIYTFDYGLPNGSSGSTSAAAQGVFPAGWGTAVGPVLENPTVTVASGAGVRVARTGTYTRVISLDFVGVYVMWEALAATATSLLFPSHRLNPAMLRR